MALAGFSAHYLSTTPIWHREEYRLEVALALCQ
jgi:hypothetical protein